ncbi:MAG: GNAT family N-acetyltransferase [Chloroflexota bacterium]|jgi:GNAT superfamily N-acetyltransferase|nr:GNAT family N-acetyltransferase [Chloroflexota bacterium]
MDIQRDDFCISTDKDKLQLDVIHRYLTEEAYWTTGQTRAMTEKTIQHSLCFGVYHRDQQVGFARVVTDYTIFAYLCDVFILTDYQGQGLGKWLTEVILDVLDEEGVRWTMLATRDAHTLYEDYGGFQKLHLPEKWMGRVNPRLLRSSGQPYTVPGEGM